MPYRFMTLALFLLFLATTTPAADLYPLPDGQIVQAALNFKLGNYHAAWKAALNAPQGNMREFLLGYSAMRLNDSQEAADHLTRAAESFPLLADYALYGEARALYRLARFTEAVPPLQRLMNEFPGSPLVRSAQALYGDALYESRDYKNAYDGFQKFIEKFPSGTDSLAATYKSALCLEQLGDVGGAVLSLKSIWLKYPGSPYAAKADDDLQRIAAKGVRVEPYRRDELLQRATTLYDLRKYDEAAKELRTLLSEAQPPGSTDKYSLKMCLALFKARHYKEAEPALLALLQQNPNPEINLEATYWLAKTLDKNGKEEEAFTTFMKLAESTAGSEMADKSLFEAAMIRRGEKRWTEGRAILSKLLLSHPATSLKQTVTWEMAWGSYRAGDMKTAAECFKDLIHTDANREKALYWYGHALAATGDIPGAQSAFSDLLTEFPFGFYAQSYRKKVNLKYDDGAFPAGNFYEMLPIPPGFERVKALISLGLFEEARGELSSIKKKLPGKGSSNSSLARLYLEMGDYHGAYTLLGNVRPKKFDRDTLYQWGICYPQAYRDYVVKMAAAHNVPEGLVYAIIRAESSFSPTALSPVGAVGLMQLMPTTAATIAGGGREKFDSDLLTKPETNIRFGVRHLRDLLALYQNDSALAIAAYNAGSGNVNRWRKSFGELPQDEFIESIPFAETREYVKKVLASVQIYNWLYKLDGRSDTGTTAILPGKKETPPTQPAASPQSGSPLTQASNSTPSK